MGALQLVHSKVNKIWYQNISLKHAVHCSYIATLTLPFMCTWWADTDQQQ